MTNIKINDLDEQSKKNFLEALTSYDVKLTKPEHKLFYVYYNVNKFITAISPVHDESLADRFEYTQLPYRDVIEYLTGKKQMSRAVLIPIADSNKFLISGRQLETANIYYVVRQLIEIPKHMYGQPALSIINDTGKKVLKISLHKTLREIKETYLNDTIKLYFTTPGNPLFLIEDIFVDVRKLHEGESIHIAYTQDLEQCSLYTKRVFNYYSYGTI